MIRVLLVSHSPNLGGAERCLTALLSRLDRRRFEPIVALPALGPLAEDLNGRGIPFHVTPLRWWVGVRKASRAMRYVFQRDLERRVEVLASIIHREDVHVVFSNSLVFLEGALAARQTRRRHVWHALEMMKRDPDLMPLLPVEHVYARLAQLTDRVAAVSACVRDELAPYLGPHALQVIHTGIEPPPIEPASAIRAQLGISSQVPLVTYAGLLSRRKGALTLVQAAPQILKRVPNAVILLAGGEGGVGSEIRRRIRQAGLCQSVRVLGHRSDVKAIVSASDLFVLPPLSDPLPVAVLEAMALGKPVVATHSGGCSEMVDDTVTGLLVRSEDPNSLAKAVIRLLMNPDQAKRMGAAGRTRATEHFSMTSYVAFFEATLEELANQPRMAAVNLVSSFRPEEGAAVGTFTRWEAGLLRLREIGSATRLGAVWRRLKVASRGAIAG